MAQYGMIYDTSTIKSQLAEANRDYYGRKTWRDLYGSINYAKQKQIGQLEKDYSTAMAEAYASAYRTNQGIAASNLGEGYKAAAMEENDLALEEAYNAYKQNYLSGVAEIETAAAQQTQTVTDALTKQAEYIRDFANTPYQYLQYLFEQYGEGDKSENIFYNEELWKRYTNEVKDEQGNLTGERELKSWDEIVNQGAYEEITDRFGNTQKQWTGLYDDSGNLTIKGADFFDQMLNSSAYEGRGISFGEWLAENNEELYDWSQSYNPYNWAPDAYGQNKNVGSFKTMVGLTSTDEKYTFMERFGGLSKSEVDKMYSGFTSKLTELNSKINKSSGRDTKEITNEFTDLTAQIGKLTDQLGITADIENELGMSLDDLGKYLANNASNAVSNGDIWYQGISNTLEKIESGALMGAAVGTNYGAIVGTAALPLLGTAAGAGGAAVTGAILGAISGLIVGVASSINQSEQTKEQNRALAKASRDAYDNLVTTLITYSQNKQRQAQIDYYKK